MDEVKVGAADIGRVEASGAVAVAEEDPTVFVEMTCVRNSGSSHLVLVIVLVVL